MRAKIATEVRANYFSALEGINFSAAGDFPSLQSLLDHVASSESRHFCSWAFGVCSGYAEIADMWKFEKDKREDNNFRRYVFLEYRHKKEHSYLHRWSAIEKDHYRLKHIAFVSHMCGFLADVVNEFDEIYQSYPMGGAEAEALRWFLSGDVTHNAVSFADYLDEKAKSASELSSADASASRERANSDDLDLNAA